MKVILFIFSILLVSSNSFGQNYHAAVEMPEMNIMYRGYNNMIEVAVTNADSSEIELDCVGCSVEKMGDGYIVKPASRARELYLNISIKENDSLIVVKRILYQIQYLPTPELYWGGSQNGTKAHIRSTKLFAKYPREIPLNTSFEVTKWTLETPNDTISGTGSNLTSAQEILKKITEPTTVTFSVVVLGEDGIYRKQTGTWNVGSWDKEKPYKIEPCSG